MIILGVLLFILGWIFSISILVWVGIILAVVGAVLFILNRSGRGPLLY